MATVKDMFHTAAPSTLWTTHLVPFYALCRTQWSPETPEVLCCGIRFERIDLTLPRDLCMGAL
jgi:hypothetical protein